MRHKKITRLLTRFVDKEWLNKKAIIQIEEHLKVCADCKAELDSLKLTKELISQKEGLEPGRDFLERLKERLRPEPEIIRVRWVLDAGILAKRLIPLPVAMMVLVVALAFGKENGLNPIEDYLLKDLTFAESALLGGYLNSSDLLNNMMF